MSSRINPAYFVALVLLYFSSSQLSFARIPKKTGLDCIFCTIGVGLVEQLSQIHNETITTTLERVCKLFADTKYREACEMVVQFIGPELINLFSLHYPPDDICAKLSMCPEKLVEGKNVPRCRLFRKRSSVSRQHEEFLDRVNSKESTSRSIVLPPVCSWPGAQFICKMIERLFSLHVPIFDMDGDGFSTSETFRGSAWRGKDCDDLHLAFHPGSRPVNSDVELDSNCNGILGVDHRTGQPFEKLFCENSSPRGLMILGDSAGAHFHIPEQWLDPRQLNSEVLTHLPYALANELDWPMTSFATGYKNVTWPIVDGYTISVYNFLKRRNLCNHRDYHNIGVNGADSNDPPSYIQNGTIRNREADYPLLLFYEFVGNDVCNTHNDTLAHMTTPKQMRKNVLRTLYILDTLLPRGSHVLMTGLANGSFLWEGLHKRLHPIGRLNRDVGYPDLYEFLSCVGHNPCTGWMTKNNTLRRLTSERAEELSEVIRHVANEYRHSFRNFDVEYIRCPLTKIVEDWVKDYGVDEIWKLIESTDGFHPNQLAGTLIAKHVWSYMERHMPHFIGPENPHNGRIAETFGDQGGY